MLVKHTIVPYNKVHIPDTSLHNEEIQTDAKKKVVVYMRYAGRLSHDPAPSVLASHFTIYHVP